MLEYLHSMHAHSYIVRIGFRSICTMIGMCILAHLYRSIGHCCRLAPLCRYTHSSMCWLGIYIVGRSNSILYCPVHSHMYARIEYHSICIHCHIRICSLVYSTSAHLYTICTYSHSNIVQWDICRMCLSIAGHQNMGSSCTYAHSTHIHSGTCTGTVH